LDLVSPRPWKPDRVPTADPVPTIDAVSAWDLSDESSQMLLAEAEAMFVARREQAVRAETRATTLQASAGIAIGLALTGAAFLVDPTKVADRPWRIALAVVFAMLLLCLGMAGYLANRATTRLLTFNAPEPPEMLRRASMKPIDAAWSRSLDLLRFRDENLYFIAFKIKNVKVASLWFRGALASFALLAGLLAVYAIAGPIPHS
jgi:hypothetical protein